MDDLWGLFYVVMHFVVGSLPWEKYSDKKGYAPVRDKLLCFSSALAMASIPDSL